MCKQTGNCQRRRVMAALTPASPPKIEFDKRCVFVADKLSRKSRQHFSPHRFLSAFTPADFNCSFYFDGVRQGSTPHIFNWRVCSSLVGGEVMVLLRSHPPSEPFQAFHMSSTLMWASARWKLLCLALGL